MFDPYLIPGSETLKNKLNIQDKNKLNQVETDLSLRRISEQKENPIKGSFDYLHLQAIHKHIFQDVYEWAGQPRTIGITKAEPLLNGQSINYPHPKDTFDSLEKRTDYVFKQLKKDNHLKNLDKKTFTIKLAKHATEIWEAHPFREGNTRTTLVFIKQLAKEVGHEFHNESVNTKEIRNYFVKAVNGNYKPLEKLIDNSIAKKFSDLKKYYTKSSPEDAIKKHPELKQVYYAHDYTNKMLDKKGIVEPEVRTSYLKKIENSLILEIARNPNKDSKITSLEKEKPVLNLPKKQDQEQER